MPNLHNVTKNFLVVNCMGAVIFLLLTLTLVWIHIRFMWKRSYYTSDRCNFWLLILFVVWVGYYLTLVTMTIRHAG